MKKALITVKQLDKEVQLAILAGKRKKINCGDSLFVDVLPSGLSSFYIRVYENRGSKLKSLGRYPDVSLKEAREKARKIVLQQKEKKIADISSAPTFAEYSQEWLKFFICDPNSENTHKNNKRYSTLKSSIKVLAGLSNYKIDRITPTIVDKILSSSDKSQGAKYNAIRAMNQCLNSAVVDGVIPSNPCINMLNSHGLISQKYRKPKVIGYAWVQAEDLGEKFFNKLKHEQIMHRVVFLMLAFTCLRIGSLIAMQWAWIDFENKVIHVPAYYMKMSRDFDIPLTVFMEQLLNFWKNHCDAYEMQSEYVFFAKSSMYKPIRLVQLQEAVTNCTQKEVTMHGIRKSARTWMAKIGVPETIAEYVLSHVRESSLVNVYNKHDYLRKRMGVMRLWNYFIYSLLPDEFKALVKGIPETYLEQCKKDLASQIESVASFSKIF